MAVAKRDKNRVPTLIGVSKNDSITPTLVAVDPATGELLIQGEEKTPTDATRINPSYVFTYSGANITKIELTTGGVTYTRTLTYSGDNITDISVWT